MRVHMQGRLNPHCGKLVSACGLLWRERGAAGTQFTTDPAAVTCAPCRAMLEYRAPSLGGQVERLLTTLEALTSAAQALQAAAGEQHPIPRRLHVEVLRVIENALDVIAATRSSP